MVVRRAQRPDFFFVNIGANDGITNDPIHPFLCEYGWRGIAVEPLDALFAELVRNYASFPGVVCERAAITTQPRPLYYISPASEYARPWTKQVGTLDPAFLERTIAGMRAHEFDGPVPAALETAIVRVDVPCLTFDELMAKHRATRVDFINIDAEGLDYEIACAIDLARWRPAIVTLETAGLDDRQRGALEARFAAHGYVHLGPLDVFSTVYVTRRLRGGRVAQVLDGLRARLEAALGVRAGRPD
jgi:FkbM family methyltransferase